MNSPEADVYAFCRVVYCAVSGRDVSSYPRFDLTDDLAQNGKALIQIINRSKKIRSVADIQAILDKDEPKINEADAKKEDEGIAQRILKVGAAATAVTAAFVAGVYVGKNK